MITMLHVHHPINNIGMYLCGITGEYIMVVSGADPEFGKRGGTFLKNS